MKLTVPKGELILPEDFSFELTFNHPFFSDEGSSSIPVEIPACPDNLAMLEFPSRLGKTEVRVASFPATLECKSLQIEGNLLIGGVSNGAISCTLAFRESILYAELKEKPLKEILCNKIKSLEHIKTKTLGSVTVEEAMNAAYHGEPFPFPFSDPDSGLTVFSVKVTADRFGFDTLNAVGSDDNLIYQARTYTDPDGNMLQVPDGYGLTPFLRLWRLIDIVLEEAGYHVNFNIFRQEPYSAITVLNNCADACVRWQLDYADLAPDITFGDFIGWLKDKFGAYLCYDGTSVDIRLIDHQLTVKNGQKEDLFLDDYSIIDTEYIKIPAAKMVEIDCDKKLELAAPPADMSVEEYMNQYGNSVFLYYRPDSSSDEYQSITTTALVTSEKPIFLAVDCLVASGSRDNYKNENSDRSKTQLRVEQILGSMAFKYRRSGDYEVESKNTKDKFCKSAEPCIGDPIHRHTSIDRAEETASEQAIILHLGYFNATLGSCYGLSHNVLADLTHSMSLLPDGIYHHFWKRYNKMLMAAAPEIEVQIDYPEEYASRLDFSTRKSYRGQPVVVKSYSFTVSRDGVSFGQSVLQQLPASMDSINDKDAFDSECLKWKLMDGLPADLIGHPRFIKSDGLADYTEADRPQERPVHIGQTKLKRFRKGYVASDSGDRIFERYWQEWFVAVFKP